MSDPTLDRLEQAIHAARELTLEAHFTAEALHELALADGLATAATVLTDALDDIRRRAT